MDSPFERRNQHRIHVGEHRVAWEKHLNSNKTHFDFSKPLYKSIRAGYLGITISTNDCLPNKVYKGKRLEMSKKERAKGKRIKHK